MLAIGVVKSLLAGGRPVPVVAAGGCRRAAMPASFWILMRAFASGCTAMTGVEAVSNGVTAFREPAVPHATRTLTAIIALLGLMLAGIAYLCGVYGIGATEPGAAGYQSTLSQLTAAVIGRGVFYYVTIGSVLVVLALSANTGFADFPRLCRVIAQDGFLPSSFAHRGRRLVYSQGILVLAALAGGILVAFGGITDHLIPLFAVGAFLAFTLSQAGMVAHWNRLRGEHWRNVDGHQCRRRDLHGRDAGRRARLEVSRGCLGHVPARPGTLDCFLRGQDSLPQDRPRAGDGRAARCRPPVSAGRPACRCAAGA